ncbi:MAG: multifunctional CCA addition/repair protein [Granulosicoccus sp.]
MSVPSAIMKSGSLQVPGKTYLVGGAVRDELLGLGLSDRDYVVVGSTPDAMLDAGFKPVGKDFPVFLHPETHEEYALARVERKTGAGYHGFAFNTDSSVTLEEDLSRRDLTINAIAKTPDGELIDPYNGKVDLDNRVLRHVSSAFVEDPVRLLRVARFMARFQHLGFAVANETHDLMQTLVRGGDVNNLVAERVWQEMHGALAATTPRAFFDTLNTCGALAVILPELAAMDGIPQKAEWHPEIDCYIHTMMVLEQATRLSKDVNTRFAALCHDLGKAATPQDLLPAHHGHEERGAKLTETLCARLRVPKNPKDLAIMSARYHTHCHRARELKASTLVKLFKSLDVIRKPDRFKEFVLVCEADKKGRLGFEDHAYPEAEFLTKAAAVFRQVDTASVARATEDKKRIAEEITHAQVQSIKAWLRTNTE